jgi:4-hydroxybenzoate polyprenyltransferase
MTQTMSDKGSPNNGTGDRAPLIVDLDGTLLRGDLLVELTFALIRRQPWMLLLIPIWLMGGRPRLKSMIAQRSAAFLDVGTLPYQDDLVAYIRAEKQAGRTVELVSATHQSLVGRIADHLGCFDAAFGTTDGMADGTGTGTGRARNLKGSIKADFLVERHPGGFVYAGDSRADDVVWGRAEGSIPVGAARAREADIAKLAPIEAAYGEAPDLKALLPKAMRVHQWAKNALIFLPLLLTYGLREPARFGEAALAFVVFSLIASATYIVNDLMDLSADRSHPSKQERPIASGRLPMPIAVLTAAILFIVGAVLCLPLGEGFALCLVGYVVLTLVYSLGVKAVAVLDVLTLGGLFTVRLLAGHLLIDVGLPAWLMVFSMFFFTSLALVKRLTEVRGLEKRGVDSIPGRGYRAKDGMFVLALGLTTGVASILVFILYLVTDPLHAARLSNPEILWVVPSMLAIWLPRVWLLAARGEMHDDPVAFAIRDRASLVLGGIGLLAVLAAS